MLSFPLDRTIFAIGALSALLLLIFVDDEAFTNLGKARLTGADETDGAPGTHLSGLLLVIVIFLFFARVFEASAVFPSVLLAGLFVEGLVVLFVVQLRLARDQVAHGGAHRGG